MADQQPPAQAPAGESAENLHTDPVTGEKISKSELKRRTKQRERDEKKKEKEAALPARPKNEELNPNVCQLPYIKKCHRTSLTRPAILRDPLQQDQRAPSL